MSNIEKIKDFAEDRIRIGGYNAFSFRDIANAIGIKSSSVHYHFPTKEDLAYEVAKRYTDRFIEQLEPRAKDKKNKPSDMLNLYIDLFQKSLYNDKKMCLCGVLAAQSEDLPNRVKKEAIRFFQLSTKWLTDVFNEMLPSEKKREAKSNATYVIASLEGALILSQVLGNTSSFDTVVRKIKKQFI